MFTGKTVFICKVVSMKNRSLKSELFFNVWQCHGKWVEKYFSMLGLTMKNKLENNLSMSFFKKVS